MPLAAGTRLGPYEIVAAIGAGGMGEVYKARDTRLERTVAIKVLPSEWANHPDMTARFAREAQVIASLNHPNICALHDVHLRTTTGASPSSAERQPDDIDFLVMEFLEGETLAERLKRGPLALDEALRVGIAITDALDKAHRQLVVHRDLKPGNIMLTGAGPKLLDFGLARIVGPVAVSDPGTAAARTRPASGPSAVRTTPPSPITKAGMILGTLQYMAPEQLEGLDADARTDIFALGVVLYEMVTGRRAFEGKSQVLLMSAIATAEPQPLSRVQPAIPQALDHVVKTCLAKDPDERWQTARDLLAELRWIAEGGAVAGLAEAEGAGGRRRTNRWALGVLGGAVVAILALAVPAWLYFRGPANPERLELRLSVTPLVYTGTPATNGFFALSPDGRHIAIRARVTNNDPYFLYVGPVGFLTPQRLAGTEDAAQPFWSADSLSIAFVSNGKLKQIDAAGGPARPICDATDFAGGTWNREGTIVFGSSAGLFRVPAEGGQAVALTTLAGSESGHFWPRFLPDGRRYLYLAWSGQASERAIMAGSLDAKDKTRIMAADSNAVYSSSGHLLFRRETSLYAQPFDSATLKPLGTTTRVADDVPHNEASGRGGFDVSDNGVLAFYRDKTSTTVDAGDARDWQLAWVNRGGQEPRTVGKPGIYRGVDVSPNGTRVAVHRHDAKGGDVWVLEPDGTETRITFDASHDNSMPVWSPNGERIAYASLRKDKWGLYQSASDGSGREELLVESDLPKAPMSWSPDGLRLVYWVRDPKTLGDVWVLSLDGAKKAAPLIATEANERHPQISPDGKWIAYASNFTGKMQVYVQPFPSGSGRWQVSPDDGVGADWPRWRRDGKELLYHQSAPINVFVNALVSVPWHATGAVFVPEPPKDLVRVYAINVAHGGGEYHTYAVSSDAQRFLIFQSVTDSGSTTGAIGEPDPAGGVTVVLNWTAVLKK